MSDENGTQTDSVTKSKTAELHAIARDIAVWAVTGVCAFLAYNVWQVTISVERLVVEFKHVSERGLESDEEIASLRRTIEAIRQEQLTRTNNVYEIGRLKSRIADLEHDVFSRKNKRWNLPDMTTWIDALEERNPELKIPKASNGN